MITKKDRFGNEEAIPETEEEVYEKAKKVTRNDAMKIAAEMAGLNNPREEHLKYLEDINLFNIITEQELDKKIVGEVATRKVITLCANGRLVINCQTASYNLLVNDDAGVGKDYVVAATLEILPKDIYIHKTRISPTVFTYWHNPKWEPEWTWNGKVFYPEDISEPVLNSDVFKVMSSNGSSATIVVKQCAYEIDIKGKPVMITTTATATPNPEITRRFVMLGLDSSQDQTKAIMKRHSQFKKEGIVPEYNPILIEALSYLKRVKVKIPYADLIDEHFPNQNIVMRTHYPRFLDFISASAALYQFQRKTDNAGFILAKGQDYDIARDCFLKLCSNKYMISLTINQKKILSVFESQPFLTKSVTQLHADKMNFMSIANLQTNLQNLAKYGILETSTNKDTYGRDLEVYSLAHGYKPNEKIEIPTYEEINLSSQRLKDVIDVIDVIGTKGNYNYNKRDNIDDFKIFSDNNMQNNNNINNINNNNNTIIPITSINNIKEPYFSPELIKQSGLDTKLVEDTIKEVENEPK